MKFCGKGTRARSAKKCVFFHFILAAEMLAEHSITIKLHGTKNYSCNLKDDLQNCSSFTLHTEAALFE